MLIAAQSQTAGQEQLAVIYDHNPKSIIALMARLVRARDPYGIVPPDAVDIEALVDLPHDAASIADLHRSVVERALASPADRTKAGVPDAVVSLATWLSIGPAVTLPRGYLFRESPGVRTVPIAPVPSTRRSGIVSALESLTSAEDGTPATWLDPDLTKALAMVTLWVSFTKLKAAAYYSGDVDAPQGTSRERYAEAVRARKITAFIAVLYQSIALADIRERAAWLTSPAVSPILEYASPVVKDELLNLTSFILKMKVHPWIAEAERMRLASRRYTEWSASSVTIGAARDGLFKEISEFAQVRGSTSPPLLSDMRDLILHEIETSMLRTLRGHVMLRNMMEPSDIDQAESILGLTTPSGPPVLHLHGQTWKALVMSGNMASEAVPDVLSMITRPRFPNRGPGDVSMLAGNVTAFHYTARFWAEGTNTVSATAPLLPQPTNTPPLFPEPEQPADAEGFTLYQLSPEMIRPETETEYYGDEDAIFAPYTPAGLATLLGYASEQDMLSSAMMTRIGHLFMTGGTTGFQPKTKAPRIFHSSRTRKVWRVRVDLPSTAMPTRVIALNARTAPLMRDIEAVLLRTPDSPSLTASTEALADDAAKKALQGLGQQ